MTQRLLLGALTSALACASPDRCERALDRLDRITPMPRRYRAASLENCRGPAARLDPVVGCALDHDTEDAVRACIDAFTRAVLSPRPSAPVRQGLNPLLAPD